MPRFSKGSLVEVHSNEEGFTGARFEATVIDASPQAPAPSSSSAKRKRRSSSRVLVEYTTLLADDGSFEPLREIVDVCYLRPQPPPLTQEAFEISEVVDAFHEDGWWTGIVNEVLEEGRYCVLFLNPSDQIQFSRTQLRPHQDWEDEKWVRPQKKKMEELFLYSESPLEVIPFGETSNEAWVPAQVLKRIGNNSILVGYQNASYNVDLSRCLKGTVDLHHIRPPPPVLVRENHELLDKVDAFIDSCWRGGIVTKILPEKMYLVFFKDKNKDKVLSHSELRPHMEWKDGKWFIGQALYSTPGSLELAKNGLKSGSKREMTIFNEGCATLEKKPSRSVSLGYLEQERDGCKSDRKGEMATQNGGLRMEGNDLQENARASLSSVQSKVEQLSFDAEHTSSQTNLFGKKKWKQTFARDASLMRRSKRLKEDNTVEDHPSTYETPVVEKNDSKQEIAGGPRNQQRKRGRPRKFPATCSHISPSGEENSAEKDFSERSSKKERLVKDISVIIGLEHQGVEIPQMFLKEKSRSLMAFQRCRSKFPIRRKSMDLSWKDNDQLPNAIKRRGRPPKSKMQTPTALDAGKSSNTGTADDMIMEKPSTSVAEPNEQHDSLVLYEELDRKSCSLSDDDRPLSQWLLDMHPPTLNDSMMGSSNTVPKVADTIEVTDKSTSEAPAIDVASDEVVGNDSLVEIVASDAPVEVVANDAPVDVVASDAPVEVVASDAPVEVVANDAPVEVVANDAPVEVVANDAPVEVVASDAPLEVVASDALVEVVATDAPVEVVADDGPVEVVADDAPVEAVAEDAPVEAVAEDAPVEAVAEDAPVEAVAEDAPVHIVAEDAPVHIVAEDAPVHIVAEDAPVHIVAEDAPVHIVADDAPVDIVADDAPVDIVANDAPVDIVANDAPVDIVANDAPVDIVANDAPVDGVSSHELNESLSFCFVKRLSLWKTIEAMEVFQLLPQDPHFQPLANCKEELREGLAIGHMVTFANILEKASKLQFEDSFSNFYGMLEALSELEAHGFDIKPVELRINKVMSSKIKWELLLERSEIVKTQVTKHHQRIAEADEKITEIERKIKELEEQRSLVVAAKQEQESEISSLQSELVLINEEMMHTKQNFERLTVSGWHLK